MVLLEVTLLSISKALKILKQYSVEAVTSPTSPVPKSVLSRQCFKLENGKLVLKLSHAYYHQRQQILLITGRENCDFILHASGSPDSVQRIQRDEPLIEKILSISQHCGCVLLPLRSLKCMSGGISCRLCYLHLDRLTVNWILKTLPLVLL